MFRLDAGSSRVSFAVQLELVLLLLFVLLKLELCGSLVMLPGSVPSVDHSITLCTDGYADYFGNKCISAGIYLNLGGIYRSPTSCLVYYIRVGSVLSTFSVSIRN